MQVAIGGLVSSPLFCRSTSYRFNPLHRVCSLPPRKWFQHFHSDRRSQHFSSSWLRCRISKPVVQVGPRCVAVESVDKVGSGSGKSGESPWNAVTSLALLGSGGSISLNPAAARAEEVVVDTSAQATEGAADTVLSFLFTAAFIGLSILTIGVIYLSVTEWLEKREMDAMAKAAGPEQDKFGVPVKEGVERLAPKGFGKKVEKADKDKKVEQKS